MKVHYVKERKRKNEKRFLEEVKKIFNLKGVKSRNVSNKFLYFYWKETLSLKEKIKKKENLKWNNDPSVYEIRTRSKARGKGTIGPLYVLSEAVIGT